MNRLRYDTSHWSRTEEPQEALDKYLKQYSNAYNSTKAKLFELMLEEDLTGKRVLDYGAGVGYMTIMCAKKGAEVVAIEAEPTAIEAAQLYAKDRSVSQQCTFIQATDLPHELREEYFDIIIAKDIIEHIEEDEAFIKHLTEHLKVGGQIILSTQNSLSLYYYLEGLFQKFWLKNMDWCGWDTTHLRFYSPLSLKKILRDAGFKSLRWASVYVIPYNIVQWLLLRRKKIVINGLRHFDLTFGRFFPFNRVGWNIIVSARKKSE